MNAVVEQIMNMPIIVDIRDKNTEQDPLVRMFD